MAKNALNKRFWEATHSEVRPQGLPPVS